MIYANIEAERARNGFSKEALADKIGVAVKTYYNWLSGTNPIPSTALIKMSDIFKVDIDYLLGRKKERTSMDFADKTAEEKEVV